LAATVGVLPACLACEGIYYVFSGEPGATSDAELVWGVNLDRIEPPVTAPTNPDGSFRLPLRAWPGDQVRLQSRRGGLRSAPRDFLLGSGSPQMHIDARPEPACSTAPLELDLGSVPVGDSRSRAVRLRAVCDEALELVVVRLRTASPAFEVSAPLLPQVIGKGEFLDVIIDFVPASAEPLEEVLLLEFGGAAPHRRAVTLLGTGSP
jgi:hypothetical protein